MSNTAHATLWCRAAKVRSATGACIGLWKLSVLGGALLAGYLFLKRG